jgi:hypothetical protein
LNVEKNVTRLFSLRILLVYQPHFDCHVHRWRPSKRYAIQS